MMFLCTWGLYMCLYTYDVFVYLRLVHVLVYLWWFCVLEVCTCACTCDCFVVCTYVCTWNLQDSDNEVAYDPTDWQHVEELDEEEKKRRDDKREDYISPSADRGGKGVKRERNDEEKSEKKDDENRDDERKGGERRKRRRKRRKESEEDDVDYLKTMAAWYNKRLQRALNRIGEWRSMKKRWVGKKEFVWCCNVLASCECNSKNYWWWICSNIFWEVFQVYMFDSYQHLCLDCTCGARVPASLFPFGTCTWDLYLWDFCTCVCTWDLCFFFLEMYLRLVIWDVLEMYLRQVFLYLRCTCETCFLICTWDVLETCFLISTWVVLEISKCISLKYMSGEHAAWSFSIDFSAKCWWKCDADLMQIWNLHQICI